MANNYDPIAKWYDRLSRLVFGKAQINAQLKLLEFIQPESHILIVGGGTGWILEAITKRFPQGLTITYIESSAAMMKLSKKRDIKQNKVYYINKPIEDCELDFKADFICTPFLFDNFSEATVSIVFNKLNNCLNTGGSWLFTDFTYEPGISPKWQKWLLQTMYFFFGKVSDIEATELINMQGYFDTNYEIIFEKQYFSGFIKAVVYEKAS